MIDTSVQNFAFLVGLNFVGFDFETIRISGMRTDIASAITPPSFDGIDRKIT